MFITAELNDIVESSESINIYNNGDMTVYSQNDEPYNQVIAEWLDMTENAHEMPAFGVSINKATREEMKSGLWVEFVFDKPQSHNEMPFEKLLVKVEQEWQGFNIIRYNSNDGYSGRCFYYDLVGKNMSQFYDLLVNL